MMSGILKNRMKPAAAFIGKSLLEGAVMALRIWVLMILWGWIVTPQFGVPAPSFGGMLGLFVLARLFMVDPDEDCGLGSRLGQSIGISAATLLVGYILTTLGGF